MAIIYHPSYWMKAIGACAARLKSQHDLSRHEIDGLGSKTEPLSTIIAKSNTDLSTGTANIDEYMRLIESEYTLIRTDNNRLRAENEFYKNENGKLKNENERLTFELANIKNAMNTANVITKPHIVTK